MHHNNEVYNTEIRERLIKSEREKMAGSRTSPKQTNSNYMNTYLSREEIKPNLNEGLDPELGDRLEKIYIHNQNVNTLDNLVTNFKKNLQYLQGKIEKKEKYKINYQLLSIKIQELERENLKLRQDYIKVNEEVNIKESLLNELQTILDKSKVKFGSIEDENKYLIKENDNLKCMIEDLSNKLKIREINDTREEEIIENFKGRCINYEEKVKELEEKNNELEAFYQSSIKQYEHKIRNEFSKELEYVNGKLQGALQENKSIIEKFDLTESLLRKKEKEFSTILVKKDKELENLTNIIKEIQCEIKYLEEGSSKKIIELSQSLQKEKDVTYNLLKDQDKKTLIIAEVESQLNSYKNIINNLEGQIIELNEKNQKAEEDISHYKKEFNEMTFKVKNLSDDLNYARKEKDKIFHDKVEITKILQERDNKVLELKELLTQKDIQLSKDMKREKKNRDISEKTNKELIKELNEVEDSYKNEIQNVRNDLLKMLEKFNLNKQFYIKELKDIKQICNFVDKTCFRNNSILSTSSNQIIQSLKDIMFKIDSAISRNDVINLDMKK